MSGFSFADSIYFSFLFQPEGFGNAPDVGEDSLRLEFRNTVTDNWDYIWSTPGSTNTDFQVVILPVNNPDYYGDDFQFRFRNYGSLAGSLDHYHLDYVDFDMNRTFDDTLVTEFAIVYPVNSLLKEYKSVPWDHYKNNPTDKMSDAVEVVVRNGSNDPNGVNNKPGSVEVEYNAALEAQFVLAAQTLSGGQINYAPRTHLL